MKLVLYYAPITCAMAPYITLTEAKADFEARPVNFGKREHLSPGYLKINPKHKVPVLEIDDKPLTENAAIHLWIARTFPEAKLMPAGFENELRAISIHSWCASGIHPYLTRLNNPAKVCDTPGSVDGVKRMATEALYDALQITDGMLAGRDFFFDHFTAPDAHFFWCFRRASLFEGLDLAQFKNCMAHFERMKTRASVQKVLAFEKEVQATFAKAA